MVAPLRLVAPDAGSIWIGGLIGLLVLWSSLPAARRIAGLAVCVPRFSNVAFVSVNVLIASGVAAAMIHLPTLASLWETSYGKTILVKIALLDGAMLLAAVNLLWTRPRLQASAGDRPDIGPPTATLLRRLVGSEILHRRRDHLRGRRALEPAAAGEGAWATRQARPPRRPRAGDDMVERNGYTPPASRHAEPRRPEHDVRGPIKRDGQPVTGADVTATSQCSTWRWASRPTREGDPHRRVQHCRSGARHGRPLGDHVRGRAPGGQPFDVLLVDRANG